jgi:hypothetical protein
MLEFRWPRASHFIRRHETMTDTFGNRHYQIDFDRGAIIRELPDGVAIHKYTDKPGELWRDAHGSVLPDQPQEN